VDSNSNSTPWYAEGNRPDTAAAGDNSQPSMMDQAKQQTQNVVHQTQQKAGEMVDQAKTKVMSQLEGQKERAAGTMEGVAQALRQTGQQLRDQDQAPVAQFAEGAADFVDRFTGYLNQRNINEMIGQVEVFARRQPALFLGGAFALGFMAARFLKSSGDGSMSRRDMGMAYPGGRYRADQADLAYPVEVAGTGGFQSGRMTPGTAATGTSMGATAAGSSDIGMAPSQPVGAAVDLEEESDLVTTGTDDRSEVQ